MRRAAGFLDAFIDAELARLGLPAEAYALMGFSQGAMTVLFTGLRRAVAPRAILAFSGALVAPERLAGGTGQPGAGAAGAWRGGRGGSGAALARCGGRAACGERAGGGGLRAASRAWHRRYRAWRWARSPCSGRSPAGEAVSGPSHCAFCETADRRVSGGVVGGMAAGASGMWEFGPLRPLAGKFSGRGVWMRQ